MISRRWLQWTRKSLESIQQAQTLARDSANATVAPVHLALVLFTDELGSNIIRGVGDLKGFERALRKALVKLPTQNPPPAQIGFDQATLRVLQRAEDLVAKSDGDTHVAVDHLIVALLDEAPVKEAMAGAGLNRAQIETKIKEMRGSRKVTGDNAEETYDALSKYGTDLTKRAEESKLDPVIGRDEEVRRVVQVRRSQGTNEIFFVLTNIDHRS